MTKRSGVYIAKRVTFEYKAVMILPELLVAGQQLPELLLPFGCFTLERHIHRSLWKDPKGAIHLFSTYR